MGDNNLEFADWREVLFELFIGLFVAIRGVHPLIIAEVVIHIVVIDDHRVVTARRPLPLLHVSHGCSGGEQWCVFSGGNSSALWDQLSGK
jgi:hypothetical protein